MTLSELPAMVVDRIERTESGLTVYGRFDRLDGVRDAGCFRLERGQYPWPISWLSIAMRVPSSQPTRVTRT